MTEINYVDWYTSFAGHELGIFAHVRHYRFSNYSAVRLDGGEYLFAVKGLTIDKEPQGDFRPGNAPGTPHSENEGVDFWWNRWRESRGGVVFFVGPSIDQPLRVVEVDHQSECPSRFGVLLQGDLRLFASGPSLYAYTPELKLFKLDYSKEKVLLRSFNSASCGLDDKNMSVLEIQPLCFLDWFRDSGVVVRWSGSALHNSVHSDHVIKYGDGLRLSGSGSCLGDIYRVKVGGRTYEEYIREERLRFGRNFGRLPQFCFGSPSLQMNHPVLGEGYLGIGHVKIRNEPGYVYSSGSSVDLFREELHFSLRKEYGERYIKHFGGDWGSGYIYMAFLHFLPKDMSELYISDAFLPFTGCLTNGNGPYDSGFKFSLCFPMSAGIIDDNLWITAGEGDWYSLWIELCLGEVWKSLRHRVSNLPMDDYRYFILTSSSKPVPASLMSISQKSLLE